MIVTRQRDHPLLFVAKYHIAYFSQYNSAAVYMHPCRAGPGRDMGRHRKNSTPTTTAFRNAEAGTSRPARRGRPPKFGRPSQVVALTLPEEVLDALRTIHRDPGWAIVQLVEPILSHSARRRRPKGPRALAELVHLPGRRSLIVVQPHVFTRLRGVSTIPLADGRAFLAFDRGGGLADLEIAILDELEVTAPRGAERTQLMQVRDIVRAWRRDPGLVCRVKSIIVVEGVAGVERGPLTTLKVPRPKRTPTIVEGIERRE